MAVKEFNCNKLKRTFWPFTLKDKVDGDGNVVEKGRKIIVRMPQKQVFEAIPYTTLFRSGSHLQTVGGGSEQ